MKKRGLFLNTIASKCSIHESGLMAFSALKDSERYTLDYFEPSRGTEIPVDYDFYFLNFHPHVGNVNTNYLVSLPGEKFAFCLETLPENTVIGYPPGFTGYLIPDPTLKDNGVLWSVPRPLEEWNAPTNNSERLSNVPIIGTFGFGTFGKNWEQVVVAVCEEFDEAVLNINIPLGTYTCDSEDIYPRLKELLESKNTKGITINLTGNYFSKQELIEWCYGNDLNCFLYNRPGFSGLAACTDQAISSGKPLAVSSDITFRHIHQYIKPYPEVSLTESLYNGNLVKKMKEDWSPANFRRKFEYITNY